MSIRPAQCIVVVVTSVGTLVAGPLGTGFTYQGLLRDGGQPGGGAYHMTFTLWDDPGSGNPPVGGNQVGGAVDLPGTPVTDGVFTVLLNAVGEFGPAAFSGQPRWLQISVNGTPLGPRQPLTPTPYALFALNAPGAGLWSSSGADIYNANAGNVGIGTSAPGATLDIAGDLRARERMAFGNEAIFGADILFERVFDFTHRVTDPNTTAFWLNPFHTELFYDPAVATDTNFIGHRLTTRVGIDNPHPLGFVGGCDITTVHGGDGLIDDLRGLAVFTTAAGPVEQQTGLLVGCDGITNGVIGQNIAVEISSGHRTAGYSIDEDYSLYVRSPSRNSPLGSHYGIYLANQGAAFPNTWSIYSDGGMSYFKDAIGIGLNTPAAALHVAPTSLTVDPLLVEEPNGPVVFKVNYAGGVEIGPRADIAALGIGADSAGGNHIALSYLTPSGFSTKMRIYQDKISFTDTPVLVGRSTTVTGAEFFGMHAPVLDGAYGGMYVSTTTEGGLPFYGYAAGQTADCWTYYDGGADSWRVYNSGNRITVESNGDVGIGTTAPGFLLHVNGSAGKPGGGSWSVASDARLKKNVATLDGALSALLALRGVTYEYIDAAAIGELEGQRIGVIAQEVEQVFPDWVEQREDGYKFVTFRGFEALTIEALREVVEERDTQIQALRAEIDALRRAKDADIAALSQRLEALERAVRGAQPD